MTISRPARLFTGLILVGVALTATVATLVQLRLDRAKDATARSAATAVAEGVANELAVAAEQMRTLAALTERLQLTEAEYRTSWESSFAYEGDSIGRLVVDVHPDELDAFYTAYGESAPGLTPAYLATEPPDGHLIIAMTTADSPFRGADLAGIWTLSERFRSIEPGEQHIDGTDMRSAGDEPTGQMSVITGHTFVGPDSIERRAWSHAQIDLVPLITEIVDATPGAVGVEVTTELSDWTGTFGDDRAGDHATARAQGSIDDFVVTTTAWADGSTLTGVTPRTVWVIGLLATVAVAILGLIGAVISHLLRRIDRVDHLARHDPLTGLLNRRGLTEELERLAADGAAVLFCDIDRFKVVNDSGGHQLGDALLRAVGARLEDLAGEDVWVGRYGGDEFLIVAEARDAPLARAADLADAVAEAMCSPFELTGGVVRSSMSIGLATSNEDGPGAHELVRRADVALGHCKTTNRGGFVFYDDSMQEAELDRLALEHDLQHALDDGDFIVHYQPIVDASGATVSYEALVRWERDGRLVPPGMFLDAIADIGRMDDLGRIVTAQAVAMLAHADEHLTMHVNVDAGELTDQDFATRIGATLAHLGVAPERLVLELTEGEWVEQMDRIAPVLDALSSLGVGLAIDDFGSGYSSLGRLVAVEGLTEVKIDRSMVNRMSDGRTSGLIAGLAAGIRSLGAMSVAEGIETIEDFEHAKAAGIDRFQGYFFGRPGPAHEVGLVCPIASTAEVVQDASA